jgi:Predicted secreted protein containing a PDZ domain
MKRTLTITGFALLLCLVFVAGFVRLPYYAVGPGPAREVEPLIDVSGHQRYPSSGKFIMTTVRWYQVTPFQALLAWIDPNESLVKQDVLYPRGVSVQVEQQRARSDMDQSKIDATYVVLSKLTGYPKIHAPGALIEDSIPGCPADGKLYSGDTILAINDTPVRSVKEASRLLDAFAPGRPIDFHISAAGETHDISVAKGKCPGESRPLIGINLVDPFPFKVAISSGDIGGPSAGLMFALGLYDTLTPGDLTQGRTIAGTGTIDDTGAVGPIGGITDKVVAAERVGADIFLVPKDNWSELKGVDTGKMKLIEVASFADAVKALSTPA